jgi:uncharacterized protein
MKLLVDRLTPVPQQHDFSGSEAWWSERAPRGHEVWQLSSPCQFDLMANSMGENVILEGSAAVEFQMECSRCAARYRHALREPFRLVLEPVGERVPSDPEAVEALSRDGLCLSDELELGWYRGAEIEIESYLAEVLSLALPAQPVCRDDCAGLCPECGANRNEAECGCSETKPNSPFAALASLQLGQPEGKV